MNTLAKKQSPIVSPSNMAERVSAIDWEQVSHELDAQGSVMVGRLLFPAECNTLAALYEQDALFRSRVVMARHGLGRGEYKYFRYPLPNLVAELRTVLYPYLVPIAN